jgi:hypothetical protein
MKRTARLAVAASIALARHCGARRLHQEDSATGPTMRYPLQSLIGQSGIGKTSHPPPRTQHRATGCAPDGAQPHAFAKATSTTKENW